MQSSVRHDSPYLPLLALSADVLANDFGRLVVLPVDGTGKRKVDGELAATRLGSTATEKWANVCELDSKECSSSFVFHSRPHSPPRACGAGTIPSDDAAHS